MPEWAAQTPWWVVAGLTVTLLFALFRAARWTASTDNRLDTLEALVKEIREDVKKIFNALPVQAVKGGSPVRLTEFGERISTAVSAKEWAADHAPGLVDEASGKPEFEVFEICVRHVAKQMEDSDFKRTVRAAAYEHATDPEQVRKVYEVELRDRLLELAPRPTGQSSA